MDSRNDAALRALREAEAFAENYRFELSDEYLALIDAVEALPPNQSGSQKSSRWLGRRAHTSVVARQLPSSP